MPVSYLSCTDYAFHDKNFFHFSSAFLCESLRSIKNGHTKVFYLPVTLSRFGINVYTARLVKNHSQRD